MSFIARRGTIALQSRPSTIKASSEASHLISRTRGLFIGADSTSTNNNRNININRSYSSTTSSSPRTGTTTTTTTRTRTMATTTTADPASEPYTLPAAASEGFKDAAAYDAHRPSYPPEAVSALLTRLRVAGQPGARIVDLAAGTGKFTTLLAARDEGFAVAAVEPHAGMRAQLEAKHLPRVVVEDGHAAAMPVESGWADACVAAQAFHWFSTESTLKEVHRVLKDNGAFGMIWNIEDYNKPKAWKATTAWEQSLSDWIWSIANDPHPRFRDSVWKDVFAEQLPTNPVRALADGLAGRLPRFSLPLGEDTVRWTVWLSEEALWARLGTLSQVAVLQGAAREEAARVFAETLRMSDVERNEKGEIAVHGQTYFAWTDKV